MGTKGGGAAIVHKARLLIAFGGEGEARAPVLVLHTLEMHVDLSFSYLRFAEAASFDKKELRRSCTNCTFMNSASDLLAVHLPRPTNETIYHSI
jgi:hypothetical protein